MATKITLLRYLYFSALIARTPGTSKDLSEAVEGVMKELEALGWNRNEHRTWEQWLDTDLVGPDADQERATHPAPAEGLP